MMAELVIISEIVSMSPHFCTPIETCGVSRAGGEQYL
jgi:hypothetical protein